jgi:hypothetical protein
MARELVRLFVNAKCSHEERHLRRLAKVTAIERGSSGRLVAEEGSESKLRESPDQCKR